jgi:hypothetical protein
MGVLLQGDLAMRKTKVTPVIVIRYFAEDLLKLTPGQPVKIGVIQEHIDKAKPGDRRNCAFVVAIHAACDAVYRAEVAGNDVYIWLDVKGVKWRLAFYMTEEVWGLATKFDEDKSKVKPVTIPIHFHEGKVVNRVRGKTRAVHKYEPTVAPKAKLESQVLSAAPDSEGPVIKPISVPGQKAANAKAQSRWAREHYYHGTTN